MVKQLFVAFLLCCSLCAEEAPPLDMVKISEAMGHLIGKNLQDLGLKIDLEAVVKGLQDSASGKSAPLSEDQCVQALSSLQAESFALLADKNLAEANAFLEKNSAEEGIVSLEEGQVQYRIVKEGKDQAVQPYNSPLVRYSGRYLDGQSFGGSEGDEILPLDETIPGFSKGILGMKEGEARTLYIHPDLGYGLNEGVKPNSLLIFEVEVIQADASADAHAASNGNDITSSVQSETTR